MSRIGVGPAGEVAVETPSIPWIAGTSSSRVMAAEASTGSAPSAGPTVATMTGWLLKSNELTWGSTALGQVEPAPPG